MSITPPEKIPRGKQPKCTGCSHPRSFHGKVEGECKALGCTCVKWKAPEPEPVLA